jgi:transposase InsO family protein/transposase-like protein
MALLVRELKRKEKHRRQPAWQMESRDMEREVRKSAVAFTRWLVTTGAGTVADAARRTGLEDATLAGWVRDWRSSRLEPELRGRKMERPDPALRNIITALFQLAGPGVSVSVLQEMFPDVARRELEDLQRRYQNAFRKRGALLIHALRWTRVGAVWAMDFTEPTVSVDGVYRWILIVRDLASGLQLMAQPVRDTAGQTVRDALRLLFAAYGTPLVIKSDNGSAFIADETRALLAGLKILQLLSPPGLPAYNGSCEAGVGSVKTRAHEESARHDHPGEWTCDDVEAARLMANQTARPWGLLEPTPDEAWNNRLNLRDDEREALLAEVGRSRPESRAQLGYLPGIALSTKQEDAINRLAISRALVARGILKFRRRRVSPPINSVSRQNIS